MKGFKGFIMKAFQFFWAFAALIIASQVLAAAPQKQKVSIKISDEILAELSETQRADLLEIASIFERRLFTWTDVPIELPQTIFDLGKGQIITISDFFQAPTSDEVQRIGSEHRKLNDAQLAQLQEEGLFVVPSEEYPGQNHVWKMNFVLQTGRKNIELFLQRHKAQALDQILVKLPARIWGDSPLSLKRGVNNFKKGFVEAVGLFVGLAEKHRTYSDAEVNALIAAKHAEYQRDVDQTLSVQGVAPAVDLRLFDDKLVGKALPLVAEIERKATEVWEKGFEEIKARLVSELKAAGVADADLPQMLTDSLIVARQNHFYGFLAQDEALEKLSPGLGHLIVEHGKAIDIVSRAEAEFNDEIVAYAFKTAQDLRILNPVRSRVAAWLDQNVREKTDAYYQSRVWAFYGTLPGLLAKENLHQEATLLSRELQFMRENEPNLRKAFESVEDPDRVFKFEGRIWRKSRWEVVKQAFENGRSHYVLRKTTPYVVATDSPLWRIKNAWYRATTRTNNWLYGLILKNIWNGPLGFRALFGVAPFRPNWKADMWTGEIVPSGERQTMVSRINSFWETRRQIQEAHEKSNNTGMFGKKFERVGLFFMNDIGRGLIAPALVAMLQPVATAANVVASTALAGASLVAAPVTSLLQTGFYATIYDGDSPNGHSGGRFKKGFSNGRLLPLLSRLLGKSALGAGETVGSIIGMVVHPTAAALHVGVGQTGAVVRKVVDAAVFKAIKKWAKVPGRDSRLIARRVSGPGLASDYFFQIDQEMVLVGLRAQLEYDELYRYEKAQSELINEPKEAYEEMMRLMSTLTGSADYRFDSPSFKPIDEQQVETGNDLRRAVRGRSEQYRELLSVPNQGIIKLSGDQYEEVLKKSAVLVEQFYSRVFTDNGLSEAQVSAFWKEWNLKPGDWVGLAKSRLTQVFGHQILTPLEKTDQTLVIKVKVPTVEDYAHGLEAGILPEHLAKVRLEGAMTFEERNEVEPKEHFRGAARLCQPLLTDKDALAAIARVR